MSYDLTDDLEKARQDQVIRLRHERDMARAERDEWRERADRLEQGIREHMRATKATYAESVWVRLTGDDVRLWALLNSDGDSERDKD